VQRDEEQEPGHDRVREPPDDHDGHARKPVGEVAGREREQRDRHELGEADQAEMERAVADRVHLPADRDLRHLQGEPRAEDRRP
jgi:hypothetical protein